MDIGQQQLYHAGLRPAGGNDLPAAVRLLSGYGFEFGDGVLL